MKRMFYAVMAMLIAIPAFADSPFEEQAADANNQFGFEWLKKESKRTDLGNQFVSPLSAYLALSMLHEAADGATREQIAEALQLNDVGLSELNMGNGLLMGALRDQAKKAGVELSLANSLFVRDTFDVKQSYVDQMARPPYRALVEVLDFDAPDASRRINGWVAQETNNKIESIVPDRLPADLAMLILNATYFKGEWTDKFDPADTREIPFRNAEGEQVSVPMLTGEKHIKYVETSEYTGIELPYGKSSQDLSMIVLLPEQNRTVDELVASLDAKAWDAVAERFESAKKGLVSVYLPKLKFEYEAEMNDALKALGMTDAFAARTADLTRLTADPRAYVSEVLQKTFVGVNEEGTEAAAITKISISLESAPLIQQRFQVDRPYFFAIRDRALNAVLFAGVIRHPEGGEMPENKVKGRLPF